MIGNTPMDENVGATHLGLIQVFSGKEPGPDKVLSCPGGSPVQDDLFS
jgi:hypothetical protein